MRQVLRFVFAGVLGLLLCTPPSDAFTGQVSPPIVMLNGVTTSTASAVYYTGDYATCMVRAYTASGTTDGTVTVYGSDSVSGTFDPFIQIVHPSTVGNINNPQYVFGACPAYLKTDTTGQFTQ